MPQVTNAEYYEAHRNKATVSASLIIRGMQSIQDMQELEEVRDKYRKKPAIPVRPSVFVDCVAWARGTRLVAKAYEALIPESDIN